MKKTISFECRKIELDNGLELILHQNHSLPLVTTNIWYKVGSANEQLGATGFAHLFEHMMFQGSENVPKEMHFKYIEEAGGSLNGSTSFDRTNYYETLPSNYLELALWLESDRMGFLIPALTEEKLENQKEVVMNERRQNYDNQPYGLAWEIIFKNIFPTGHPYSWPTIGFLDDIKKFELNSVKNFFEKYYAPNNASLVIAGDFEFDETINLVKKYFESIPPTNKLDSINIKNFKLDENKLINYKDNVSLERIYFAFNTCPAFHNDDASLEMLADILSGTKNSPLYKKLVFEKQIALDVSCFQYSGKYGGLFIFVATIKQGENSNEIKSGFFEVMDEIYKNGISLKDFERSRNGIASSFVYSLQNLNTVANYLNHYNFYLNKPNSFQYDLNRYLNNSAANIKEVAKKYLSENYFELKIIPRG